jgi:hypothetical protein
VTSEIMLRPASGRFINADVSSVIWFRLSAAFRTGASAVTSTVCVDVATFIDIGRFRFWPVSSVSATASGLKPDASTVSEYFPGARLTNRKIPSEFDVVFATTPVSVFFNWTLALGTTALAGSWMVPWMLPLNCAQHEALTNIREARTRATARGELGHI